MIVSLEDWVKKIKKDNLDKERLYFQEFYHKKPNNITINKDFFLSPVEGTVLYIKEIKNNDAIVEIKGKNFTIKDLIGFNLEGEYVVIGVFMTVFDNHFNSCPLYSFYKWKKLSPLQSYNLPMDFVQADLLSKKEVESDHLNYLFYNERVINKFISSDHDFVFYVVQIADYAVNVISNFYNKTCLHQGQIFGEIIFGSQVDIVIPADVIEKIFIKEYDHIELNDRIIKL